MQALRRPAGPQPFRPPPEPSALNPQPSSNDGADDEPGAPQLSTMPSWMYKVRLTCPPRPLSSTYPRWASATPLSCPLALPSGPALRPCPSARLLGSTAWPGCRFCCSLDNTPMTSSGWLLPETGWLPAGLPLEHHRPLQRETSARLPKRPPLSHPATCEGVGGAACAQSGTSQLQVNGGWVLLLVSSRR